jgi:hypothetical protein
MRKWIGLVLLGLLLGNTTSASGPGAVRKQVESSLLVKGTIDIDADGRVLGHALERADTLADGVAAMIDRVVPRWRFEPVELREGTTRARAPMSLRIVAKKLDEDNFIVQVRGAQFGSHAPDETVSSRGMAPPRYPQAAAYAGVGGSVYTVLRIGRDGRVEDAIAEQVNLRLIASEAAMTRWRKVLAQAALHAAHRWEFDPPTKGEDADAPFWSVRVPVDFIAPGQKQPQEHEWHAYVPGPRETIPWEPEASSAGVDALAAGGIYPVGQGLRLLTPLGEG